MALHDSNQKSLNLQNGAFLGKQTRLSERQPITLLYFIRIIIFVKEAY